MARIAVVTDSDASLPASLAVRHGITVVPINVHFGDEVFESEVDIDDEQLFVRVQREGVLPTTSAPTPGQFAKAYQAAFDAGAEQVICLCVSSLVSGTYNAALNGRDLVRGGEVTVVDTRSLSIGQGFMTLAAARVANAGGSVAEAVSAAEDVGGRVGLYGALATLKYLAMSGRVGSVAAGMANLLNIKPILTLRDGKLDMLEKVRTHHRALERVQELVRVAAAGRAIEQMAVIHVCAKGEAQELAAHLRTALECPEEIIVASFTAGLSVHTGPGMLGVGFVAGA